MAINQAVDRTAMTAAEAQLARVDAQGSADHPYRLALLAANGPDSARDLADAVHLFCSLYGRHPGLIELALNNCPAGPVRDWLREASDAYERERLYLVRLTAAVGPLPSTPGAAETEATLVAQRHAIETLADSERRGCALGAATALMADWPAVRAVLDRAADRMGMQKPALTLPDQDFDRPSHRRRHRRHGQRTRARLRRRATAPPEPRPVRPARSPRRRPRRLT